jgi:hypothetical protein
VWKLEIERLDLILEAIAKEKARVESELAARAFFAVRVREYHLYIVYLKEAKPGPYTIKEPCIWDKTDRSTLVSLLQVAARQPAAITVSLRALLAGKDRSGSLVFPAGRFDIPLARRIATPLPAKHPALRPRKEKVKTSAPVIFYEEIDNGHGNSI